MTDSIRQAFSKLGVTQGYVAWLLLKSAASRPATTAQRADFDQWFDGLPAANISFWLLAPQALGLILGAGAMSGALSYSGQAPVNLWVILLLFALLPLVLTLITAIKLIAHAFGKQTVNQPNAPTLITRWLQKQLSKRLCITPQVFTGQTANYWLLFRIQAMGIALQTGAMIAFVAILLFKDVAFGWSSTLIKSPESVTAFFNYFSLPWQSLLGAPSEELITQSQFFYHQGANAIANAPWWPHLLFALFFYGLVPRILLWHWLSIMTAKRFKHEINSSSVISQMFNAEQPSSHAAKLPPQNETLPKPEIQSDFSLASNDQLLNWQQPHSSLALHTLGSERWQDDEQWLQNFTFSEAPIYVAVSEEQTPTAELSDILALLPKPATLVLTIKNQPPISSSIRSWQYFTNENHYPLILTQNISKQGVSHE